MKSFEDWWLDHWRLYGHKDMAVSFHAKEAWDYQQNKIEESEKQLWDLDQECKIKHLKSVGEAKDLNKLIDSKEKLIEELLKQIGRPV